MSEVLLDFAAPVLDAAGDDHFEIAVRFAVLCWNLSFLPEGKRQKELKHIINEIGGTDPLTHADAEDCARMLLKRKQESFADDKRVVVEFRIVDEGDDRHLTVMSTRVDHRSASSQDAQEG